MAPKATRGRNVSDMLERFLKITPPNTKTMITGVNTIMIASGARKKERRPANETIEACSDKPVIFNSSNREAALERTSDVRGIIEDAIFSGDIGWAKTGAGEDVSIWRLAGTEARFPFVKLPVYIFKV